MSDDALRDPFGGSPPVGPGQEPTGDAAPAAGEDEAHASADLATALARGGAVAARALGIGSTETGPESDGQRRASADRDRSMGLSDVASIQSEAGSDFWDRVPIVRDLIQANQRLKLHIPTHETYLTLGARHREQPIGPGGVTARTDADVTVAAGSTVFTQSGGDTVQVSHQSLRRHVAEDAHASVGGSYRLHSAQDVRITAGGVVPKPRDYDPLPSGGRSLVPPTPADADVDGPTAHIRSWEEQSDVLWGAYDMVVGAKALASFWTWLDAVDKSAMKEIPGSHLDEVKKFWDGLKNTHKVYGSIVAQATAVASMVERRTGVAAGASTGGAGEVQVFGEKSVTVRGDKVSIFSEVASSLESFYKTSVKSVFTASLKAGADATVFGGLAAKLESYGLAVVKGRATHVTGENLRLSGTGDSDGSATLTATGRVSVSGDAGVGIASPRESVSITAHRRLDLVGETGLGATGGPSHATVVLGDKPDWCDAEGDSFVALRGRASRPSAQAAVTDREAVLRSPNGERSVAVDDGGIRLFTGKRTGLEIVGTEVMKVRGHRIEFL